MTTPRPTTPLPPSVRAEAGRGGLPRLVVSGRAGSAEVYLQGAHVTAWAPVGSDPVLWTSARSAFAPATPIRGGIPVCFPWFGPHPSSAGLHGFARTAGWTLVRAVDEGDDVVLELRLTESDVPDRSGWPHPFEARLTVTVGEALRVRLDVANTGQEPVTFEEAFHTYLGVGDVRRAGVTGLAGSAYVDRLVGDDVLPPSGEALRITGETDRVYGQPGTISVSDPAYGRRVDVVAEGSANAVVWNPWQEKAVAMADFGDDEWTQMVCVETCNVRQGAITLAPRAVASMSTTIRVTPGG